ncbi:Ig-like domain-containing protein [Flavisolibacter tropicus]|uniref:Secretion system C-terminal sorting domain-containing protein n=1 Tax=Flavisolibacter tropicus TaxID=1492898 RepID=A0A172TZA6_9BACT|nr:Ig-like domain-containing protein [Flavisolibacter tropicus]ANE52278.1 hypothetical protein SY85_19100 [Flavisolibacter tropicus]
MNRIFTLFTLGLLCFAWNSTKAQSFPVKFEGSVPTNSNCWANSGFILEADAGNGNNNDAASTKGVTTATLTTPFINFKSNDKTSIKFDYKATTNSSSFSLQVNIISQNGTVQTLDNFTITNTNYRSYSLPDLAAGTYRVSLSYTSTAGSPSTNYILIDNFDVDGSFHYASFCNSAPNANNDSYISPTIVAYSGNLLTNDTDPNSITPYFEKISLTNVVQPTDGTVSYNSNGAFTFTPNAGFTGGPVTFTYTISDDGYAPLTSTATVTINYPTATAPLPIKLLSFTGQASNNQAILHWSVDDNETGEYFKVEKSSDGKTFKEAGVVLTSTNKGKQEYTYRESLTSGTGVYYRLQIINNDAPSAYSKTVLIKQQIANTNNSIFLAINPSQSTLRFTFNTEVVEQTFAHIYTINGSKIFSQQLSTVKGINAAALDINTLPKGLYILEVSSNTATQRIKFFK